MTRRLFDEDAYISEFSARVTDCREADGGFAVTLDKTAFFPEGGGQSSDTGHIESAVVSDVQECEGEILHFTDRYIAPGTEVSCLLDWEQRFRKMQNHSGEHIISGLIAAEYGLDNVGFHLGNDEITLDFNGVLTRDMLLLIEDKANRAVIKNPSIICSYPTPDELSAIHYRSKLDLKENVRIVNITGVDICACCAPHVSSAGQIGIIKLLDFHKNRDGTRLWIKCGLDALDDYNDKYRNVLEISSLLSSKQTETAKAVMKLVESETACKQSVSALRRRLIEAKISSADNNDDMQLVFEDGLSVRELQLYSDALAKKCGLAAVFTELPDGGHAFAIAGNQTVLDGILSKLREKHTVRGGGRGGMVQGTVAASRVQLEDFFNSEV